MNVIWQSTKPNEWVGVEYPGDPLLPLFLGFGSSLEDEVDWKPAFYDQGKAVIRCPNLIPGNHTLWLKQGEKIMRASVVTVLS